MTKRVIIIHGWDGYPEEGWFPWLKTELEKKGFVVVIPAMPNPSEPVIDAWVSKLAVVVGTPDSDMFFVGHSIGCQTILRYLETQSSSVCGCVFVAGWFTLTDAETHEEKRISKPWLETPIDFAKVRKVAGPITAFFSDDDDVVPLEENRKIFAEQLGAKIVIEQEKGHFSGSDGVVELPSVLKALVDMGG